SRPRSHCSCGRLPTTSLRSLSQQMSEWKYRRGLPNGQYERRSVAPSIRPPGSPLNPSTRKPDGGLTWNIKADTKMTSRRSRRSISRRGETWSSGSTNRTICASLRTWRSATNHWITSGEISGVCSPDLQWRLQVQEAWLGSSWLTCRHELRGLVARAED